MTTALLVRTIIEGVFVVALILGMVFREELVKWENKHLFSKLFKEEEKKE